MDDLIGELSDKIANHIPEIRLRALKTLRFKLDSQLLEPAEAAAHPSLLVNLLSAFNGLGDFEAQDERAVAIEAALEALRVMCALPIAKDRALAVGAIAFLKDLREDLEPQHQLAVDSILELLFRMDSITPTKPARPGSPGALPSAHAASSDRQGLTTAPKPFDKEESAAANSGAESRVVHQSIFTSISHTTVVRSRQTTAEHNTTHAAEKTEPSPSTVDHHETMERKAGAPAWTAIAPMSLVIQQGLEDVIPVISATVSPDKSARPLESETAATAADLTTNDEIATVSSEAAVTEDAEPVEATELTASDLEELDAEAQEYSLPIIRMNLSVGDCLTPQHHDPSRPLDIEVRAILTSLEFLVRRKGWSSLGAIAAEAAHDYCLLLYRAAIPVPFVIPCLRMAANVIRTVVRDESTITAHTELLRSFCTAHSNAPPLAAHLAHTLSVLAVPGSGAALKLFIATHAGEFPPPSAAIVAEKCVLESQLGLLASILSLPCQWLSAAFASAVLSQQNDKAKDELVARVALHMAINSTGKIRDVSTQTLSQRFSSSSRDLLAVLRLNEPEQNLCTILRLLFATSSKERRLGVDWAAARGYPGIPAEACAPSILEHLEPATLIVKWSDVAKDIARVNSMQADIAAAFWRSVAAYFMRATYLDTPERQQHAQEVFEIARQLFQEPLAKYQDHVPNLWDALTALAIADGQIAASIALEDSMLRAMLGALQMAATVPALKVRKLVVATVFSPTVLFPMKPCTSQPVGLRRLGGIPAMHFLSDGWKFVTEAPWVDLCKVGFLEEKHKLTLTEESWLLSALSQAATSIASLIDSPHEAALLNSRSHDEFLAQLEDLEASSLGFFGSASPQLAWDPRFLSQINKRFIQVPPTIDEDFVLQSSIVHYLRTKLACDTPEQASYDILIDAILSLSQQVLESVTTARPLPESTGAGYSSENFARHLVSVAAFAEDFFRRRNDTPAMRTDRDPRVLRFVGMALHVSDALWQLYAENLRLSASDSVSSPRDSLYSAAIVDAAGLFLRGVLAITIANPVYLEASSVKRIDALARDVAGVSSREDYERIRAGLLLAACAAVLCSALRSRQILPSRPAVSVTEISQWIELACTASQPPGCRRWAWRLVRTLYTGKLSVQDASDLIQAYSVPHRILERSVRCALSDEDVVVRAMAFDVAIETLALVAKHPSTTKDARSIFEKERFSEALLSTTFSGRNMMPVNEMRARVQALVLCGKVWKLDPQAISARLHEAMSIVSGGLKHFRCSSNRDVHLLVGSALGFWCDIENGMEQARTLAKSGRAAAGILKTIKPSRSEERESYFVATTSILSMMLKHGGDVAREIFYGDETGDTAMWILLTEVLKGPFIRELRLALLALSASLRFALLEPAFAVRLRTVAHRLSNSKGNVAAEWFDQVSRILVDTDYAEIYQAASVCLRQLFCLFPDLRARAIEGDLLSFLSMRLSPISSKASAELPVSEFLSFELALLHALLYSSIDAKEAAIRAGTVPRLLQIMMTKDLDEVVIHPTVSVIRSLLTGGSPVARVQTAAGFMGTSGEELLDRMLSWASGRMSASVTVAVMELVQVLNDLPEVKPIFVKPRLVNALYNMALTNFRRKDATRQDALLRFLIAYTTNLTGSKNVSQHSEMLRLIVDYVDVKMGSSCRYAIAIAANLASHQATRARLLANEDGKIVRNLSGVIGGALTGSESSIEVVRAAMIVALQLVYNNQKVKAMARTCGMLQQVSVSMDTIRQESIRNNAAKVLAWLS